MPNEFIDSNACIYYLYKGNDMKTQNRIAKPYYYLFQLNKVNDIPM